MSNDVSVISRNKFDLIAQWLVLLGIFFIPLSAVAVNKIFPIAIACTLIAGNWACKWSLVKNERVVIVGLILLAFITIGIFYSEAPLNYTLQGYFKYTKLIFLLFLIPLFVELKWRRRAENVLMVSVFINAIVALLNVHGIPVFGKIASVVGGYFIHQIYTSALTAFVAFILLNRVLAARSPDNKEKYNKLICGVLFIFSLYILFFVYIERTGYAIAFALFLVFLAQRLKWKGVIIALVAIPLLIGTTYIISPTFHKRINDVASDLAAYKQSNQRTSIGFRLSFVKYSFVVIKKHPIFGAGTGSFRYLYPTTGGPKVDENSPVGHPHNEYVLMLFQVGAIGLLLFLFWLGVQIYDSFRLPIEERRLMQGLTIAFFVNGFCNTSLSINSTGMLLIVFLSIYLASAKRETKAGDIV